MRSVFLKEIFNTLFLSQQEPDFSYRGEYFILYMPFVVCIRMRGNKGI